MGYFKDWQKNRRNIREALNRLPSEQPQPSSGYITNSREDIMRMEREYLVKRLKEIEEFNYAAAEALHLLRGPVGFAVGIPDQPPGLISIKGNPGATRQFGRLANSINAISSIIQKLIPSVEQPLSLRLPTQSQSPPTPN